ncbi:non-ribosomal peptide synthetase [Amycolatopsis sp. CA-230715]|uniref:non-ribosomal peptide synthetase n=1 Tax=Amycolatopsis sp. CA-230715 TaxID=2745196 RepID=UPI001C0372E6|nr:non-ribosomal peptide synthetase [Amycolatopsis sp. CA-230715]QWF82465.1 D-alanine--poly(phosphoribitol) ligase subunit 1 [Amycolatopsis sp. CA-230715]
MPARAENAPTIIDVLARNAGEEPDRTAFSFADGPDSPAADSLSTRDLHIRALAVAEALRTASAPGARILVLTPSARDYVIAVCGCLYAGRCAVPLGYAGTPVSSAMAAAVGRDAGAEAILTSTAVAAEAKRRWQSAGGDAIAWLAVDELVRPSAADQAPARCAPEDLAMLLYTSGSTGDPKGVLNSHASILAGIRKMVRMTGIPAGATVVNWVPVHHGIGLIGHLLLSQYLGGDCSVLRTEDVVARPASWLEAISAANSPVFGGGPNFVYDRCTDFVTAEEFAGLDLDNWHSALVAGERIRKNTLERFTARFGARGFARDSMFSVYGLTETTLLVSGRRAGDIGSLALDRAALEAHTARIVPESDDTAIDLVSCGDPGPATTIRVVDPETRTEVAPGRVGEIWAQGPFTAPGYWRRPRETAAVFDASLANGEGPFVRTGDLGFRHDGELFVCGRLKELLIIRGRNLYPQDIETTAAGVHPATTAAPAAAFAVEGEESERLVLVQAVRSPEELDAERLAGDLRAAVTANHRVDAEVLVVAASAVPTTNAGKIRRAACREAYLEGRLAPLATSVPGGLTVPAADATVGTAAVPVVVRRLLEDVLGGDAPEDVLASDATLAGLGLDSLRGMLVRHRLAQETGVRLALDELLLASAREVTAKILAQSEMDTASPAPAPVVVPDPAARYEPFPLTGLQQAYVTGRDDVYELGGVATHYYREFDSETLDVDRFLGSLEKLVQRHEMLHATVSADGTQRVLRDHAVPVTVDDLRHLDGTAAAERLDRTRAAMSHHVMPLEDGPLFEVRISRLTKSKVRVHIGVDLLIADVRSIQIFYDDWELLYNGKELAPLTGEVSFRDYLIATERDADDAEYRRARDYWMDRIDTMPGAPRLPVVERAKNAKSRFRRIESQLDAGTWTRITNRAGKYGVTPSAVLLAAYAVVLRTWSGSERFLLNIPMFNRQPLHHRIDEVIGDFTTILPLAVDARGDHGIAELAIRIQRQLLSDMDHRRFSGIEVLRELALRDGAATSAVAPVVFASGRGQGRGYLTGEWIGEPGYAISQTPQVWVDNQTYEKDGELHFNWDTVEGLFPVGVVEEMFAAYCGVLELLAGGDSGWESGVDSVLPGWQREVIESVNDTAAPIDVQLLHGPLVECALADPSARAVFADGEWTTFGELYVRACRTARTLRSLGVGPGQVVAVSMDKTAAQITAVVAVLLAGGVYVPIDPELPTARRHHMATHAGARLILTTEARETLDWPDNTRVALLDTAPVDLAEATRDATPEQVSQLDDLAYIIYTSGSTGLPKGVAITHRAASNTCLDINARFGVTSADRALALSSLSFDLSVWDVFGVLGAGGSLVLPATGRDPAHWHELITTHDITVWNSVPALMTMYTEHLPTGTPATSLRLVMLSGDWIPLALPDNLWATHPDIDLYSLGGATEAAIWSVYHPITALDPEWTSIPYGTPLANQQLHVLDTQLQPCPIHTTGDLYISGDGLATGYHNDPGKTHAAFLTHPTTGTRLYKTGDLARRHPDGTLEFLGRTDTQVKINGHRIELGEIETTLTTHPDIHTAIATTTGPPHHKQLHAYLYPHPHTTLTPEQLRTQTHHHLTHHLPTYMHPTTTTILTHLPLTPNGKINRNHLPHPTTTTPATTEEPASQLEKRILVLVGKILDSRRISVTANFFDLGLDSVVMVKVHRELRDGLGRDFALTDLFENPSIRHLAAHLGGADTTEDAVAATFARARDRRARRRPQTTTTTTDGALA